VIHYTALCRECHTLFHGFKALTQIQHRCWMLNVPLFTTPEWLSRSVSFYYSINVNIITTFLLSLSTSVYHIHIPPIRDKYLYNPTIQLTIPSLSLSSVAQGGTTPTVSELAALCASLASATCYADVPIRIMIRPRGPPSTSILPSAEATETSQQIQTQTQDFLYTAQEITAMREAILRFKESGFLVPERGDSFVFGLLKLSKKKSDDDDATEVGTEIQIDIEANKELVQLAAPFKCVFHRAFDDVVSCGSGVSLLHSGGGYGDGNGNGGGRKEEERWQAALRAVKGCGFDGVLTSGGKGNAVDHCDRLGRIVRHSGDSDCNVEVVVGGGVRSGNIPALVHGLGLGSSSPSGAASVWFHSSCLAADGEFDAEETARLVARLRGLGGGS